MTAIEKITVDNYYDHPIEATIIETSPYDTWDVYVGEELKGEITSYYNAEKNPFPILEGMSYEESKSAPEWSARRPEDRRSDDGFRTRERAVAMLISY